MSTHNNKLQQQISHFCCISFSLFFLSSFFFPTQASSFVNGLVNAGYGTDKLMTVEDSQWVYKNKAEGKISAVASLGLIMLWNTDEGLTAIDRFL